MERRRPTACKAKGHRLDQSSGKLASLNRSWQSKEGTFRALGMAGIEPTPPESHVTGPSFRLNHSAKGAVTGSATLICKIMKVFIFEFFLKIALLFVFPMLNVCSCVRFNFDLRFESNICFSLYSPFFVCYFFSMNEFACSVRMR